MMKTRVSMLLLFAAAACGGGGGSENITGTPPGTPPPTGPSGPSPTASVQMRSEGDIYGDLTHSFNPVNVIVARNGTVTWTNSTGEVHNVTFGAQAGAPAHVADHASGTNSRTFTATGIFNYSCTNHVGMTGSISVQ